LALKPTELLLEADRDAVEIHLPYTARTWPRLIWSTFAVLCRICACPMPVEDQIMTETSGDQDPSVDPALLFNATASGFQRHIGWVLCSRTKICIVTRSRTPRRPMPSSAMIVSFDHWRASSTVQPPREPSGSRTTPSSLMWRFGISTRRSWTANKIQQLRAKLVEKKLSDKSINNIMACLSKSLRYAVVPEPAAARLWKQTESPREADQRVDLAE